MYYIKHTLFLTLLVFISACAQEIQPDEVSDEQDISEPISAGIVSTSQSEITRYKKAITFINNSEYDKAQPILLDFTEQRPELAGPWANLGLIKLNQNDYTAAETYLKTALKSNPELPQALNLMAVINLHKGKIKEAEKLYLKSIAIKPNYALAHYNLALLYDIYLQNIPAAIIHYQSYLKLIKTDDKGTRDWLEQLVNSQKKG